MNFFNCRDHFGARSCDIYAQKSEKSHQKKSIGQNIRADNANSAYVIYTCDLSCDLRSNAISKAGFALALATVAKCDKKSLVANKNSS